MEVVKHGSCCRVSKLLITNTEEYDCVLLEREGKLMFGLGVGPWKSRFLEL